MKRIAFFIGVYCIVFFIGEGIATAVNSQPICDPGGPYSGTVGIAIQFDGTGSFDPDGDPLVFDWGFGDGNFGSGPTPTHTYAAAGTYSVQLTVTDGRGYYVWNATTATVEEEIIVICSAPDFFIVDSHDIHPLSGCTEIEGNLTIDDTDLTSLTGLEKLTGISGFLYITNNNSLTSLAGLDNLANVGGDLKIDQNTYLSSLHAFSNLTSVGGGLFIINNSHFTSLSGLANLTNVGDDLYINNNNVLPSLSGLNNITSVDGDLYIWDNTALTSLNGLENLTSVGGLLYIRNNTALTSLNGLENLTSVGLDLEISYSKVTNLCALYNTNVAGNDLYIYRNTLLSMETAYALETKLRNNGFTGTATIFDNNGSELVSCDPEVPGIYGNVSGSCGGPALQGVYMLLYRNSCGSSTYQGFVLTAADGNYSFIALSNGNYKVKPLKTGYTFSPPEIILDFTNTAVTGVNFTAN